MECIILLNFCTCSVWFRTRPRCTLEEASALSFGSSPQLGILMGFSNKPHTLFHCFKVKKWHQRDGRSPFSAWTTVDHNQILHAQQLRRTCNLCLISICYCNLTVIFDCMGGGDFSWGQVFNEVIIYSSPFIYLKKDQIDPLERRNNSSAHCIHWIWFSSPVFVCVSDNHIQHWTVLNVTNSDVA